MPPSALVGRSSAGPYVVGVLVMGGLIGGLVYWQSSKSAAPAPSSSPVATATASASGAQASKLPEYAPPALREDDAAPSASAIASEPTGAANAPAAGGPGKAGACDACGSGTSSGELNSAVRSRAGGAQGCYQRALRQSESEGSVTVAVSIGADGSVCGVNAVSDTLNNPAITSCVISKFRSGSFPKPQQGCVVVQVPISFKSRR